MNDITKGFVKASLILLAILTVLYVIAYKSWENKEFDDNIDYSEYLGEPQLQETKKITEKEAKELYEKINFKFIEANYGKEFFDIYYNNKDFSNEFMLYLSVINLQGESFKVECNNNIEIDKEIINKKIKELFGTNIEYQDTSLVTKDNNLSIKYIDNQNKYLITTKKCSGNVFGTGYVETEFIEYNEDNNILEIIEYAYYIDYQKDNDGKYIINYYNSLDNKGKVIATESLSKNKKTSLLKYKLIFEKDKDNNYVFKKVEKLK